MVRAIELMKNGAKLIENYHSHHLAFNNNYSPFVVNCHTSWVAESISAKLPYKLSILVIDLYLMCRGTLSYNDISTGTYNGYSVRVEKLSISLPTFPQIGI